MNRNGNPLAIFIVALLLATVGGNSAHAVDAHDHDRARQAVAAGEILPLKAILERVEREHPGQVMDVELEQMDERWIYEIKVLRSGGAMVKLKIDARDGKLLSAKERDATRGGKRPPGAKP